jgi:hypothetical protein
VKGGGKGGEMNSSNRDVWAFDGAPLPHAVLSPVGSIRGDRCDGSDGRQLRGESSEGEGEGPKGEGGVTMSVCQQCHGSSDSELRGERWRREAQRTGRGITAIGWQQV